ncbi:hypothetical protein M0804_001527 [Polistes exclamans]|nr:hypothetical protein M0804_001527 [Polistes exclamans]
MCAGKIGNSIGRMRCMKCQLFQAKYYLTPLLPSKTECFLLFKLGVDRVRRRESCIGRRSGTYHRNILQYGIMQHSFYDRVLSSRSTARFPYCGINLMLQKLNGEGWGEKKEEKGQKKKAWKLERSCKGMGMVMDMGGAF